MPLWPQFVEGLPLSLNPDEQENWHVVPIGTVDCKQAEGVITRLPIEPIAGHVTIGIATQIGEAAFQAPVLLLQLAVGLPLSLNPVEQENWQTVLIGTFDCEQIDGETMRLLENAMAEQVGTDEHVGTTLSQ